MFIFVAQATAWRILFYLEADKIIANNDPE